jgi:uncharacterized protein (DUF362 family)/Pyruvate/2-oxoacid:ferredoxin oxidoreductase delta subunit
MTAVSIKAIADYDPERIESALRACLAPLGGMGAFVRPGQRVLVKPNLVGAFPVEQAVTPPPAVVRAVIRLAQQAGGRVRLGDSPGMGTLERAVQVCGLAPVLAETGVELADCSVPHEFDAPENVVARRLTLTKALLETDVIISLPKLKTHAQMMFTGAIKNQFGLIPGALKSQWHFRLQQPEWLASLILDVNRAARPALAIMDGIIGMEGPGPAAGRPRRIGALLAGSDFAAVDTVACHLIGLDPMRVPLLAAARRQGFGETALEAIQLAGDDWRALRVPDFEKVEQLVDLLRILPLPKRALRGIRRLWAARPRIINGKCTRCGLCEKGCPVPGAAIHPKLPAEQQVDDDRCIACYCCHEFCPFQAIELKQPWLTRWLPLTALANRAARLAGHLGAKK